MKIKSGSHLVVNWKPLKNTVKDRDTFFERNKDFRVHRRDKHQISSAVVFVSGYAQTTELVLFIYFIVIFE